MDLHNVRILCVKDPCINIYKCWLSATGAQGAPLQKTTFAPLKGTCPPKNGKKIIERIIEKIAYCFKNNDLLSFASP